MKKSLLSAIVLSLSMALIVPNVNAQSNTIKPSFKNVSIPNSEADAFKIVAPSSKGESRAFKNFSKNYKRASNVSWHYSGEVLVANFSEGNTKKRVMYLNNGQWLRTLIHYDESQLSDYVKSMVARKYPKFTITGVTEVHETGMIAFFINLDNGKEIKQVISYEDEVWTHKQFRKG